MGQSGWVTEPRFEDSLSRWKNRDELDSLIGPVTAEWDAHKLMTAYKMGVSRPERVRQQRFTFDPHLVERGFYEVVEHEAVQAYHLCPTRVGPGSYQRPLRWWQIGSAYGPAQLTRSRRVTWQDCRGNV
ncbi:MAG: hypothetical protein CM1200mP27_12820 [Chloroflexota bacterium]|nr:MAG: hypothetical protein CM1200mP27_12820 [Chloroflexota bacterium]